jgi:alpha-methylacyl-CoA racemase
MSGAMAGGPLQGFRVLEFGGFGPGPLGATLLADMGADLIRIDRLAALPLEDDEVQFDIYRRSRRCIALDLRSPRGTELALRLVESAHGLIDPYRPGVMERLGLSPDTCLARNARLVYGRVTGWGQTGPIASRAGHDANYIAMTGALHAIASREGMPVPPLNFVGDGAGGLLLAFGMVCGLLEAERSGQGQVLDAAMVDAASLLFAPFMAASLHGRWGAPGSNLIDGGAHFYNVYATSDGEFVSVAAIEPQFYAELIQRIGWNLDELPPQMDQKSWPVMRQRFADLFRSRTRAAWCALLDRGDTCFAPVLTAAEALEHPQSTARQAFTQLGGVPHPMPAPRFSRSGGRSPEVPRPRGADSMDILTQIGVSPEELEALRASRVVL